MIILRGSCSTTLQKSFAWKGGGVKSAKRIISAKEHSKHLDKQSSVNIPYVNPFLLLKSWTYN